MRYLLLITLLAASLIVSGNRVSTAQVIIDHQKLGQPATLGNADFYGSDVSPIGDLDGNGVIDLLVGAEGTGSSAGAIYVLFMQADGSYLAVNRIDGSVVDENFGSGVAGIGDLDNDGVADIAVGAPHRHNGSSIPAGAVEILLMNADGTTKSVHLIADGTSTTNSGPLSIDGTHAFGASIASIGDLDGDGVIDLAIGAPGYDGDGFNKGAVLVLFMHGDGSVKGFSQISESSMPAGFSLAVGDFFGGAVALLPDLDGDGVPELIVGAPYDNTGGTNRGAAYILFMNADGTVKDFLKISEDDHTPGGFALNDGDRFGSSIAVVDDLTGNGLPELLIGAPGSDEGGTNLGAVYLMNINVDGSVSAFEKITALSGGFTGQLESWDEFGKSVAFLGDFRTDGTRSFAAGAPGDRNPDPADLNRDAGAVWLLFTESLLAICDDPGTVPFWDGVITSKGDGSGFFLVDLPAGFLAVELVTDDSDNITLLEPGDHDCDLIGDMAAVGDNRPPGILAHAPGNSLWEYEGGEEITRICIRIANERAGSSSFMVRIFDRCERYLQVDPLIALNNTTARIPTAFALESNYPNPFNPTTTIRFHLPQDEHVTLTVYDVLGREVRKIVDARLDAGIHTATWHGQNEDGIAVASGVYLYRIVAGSFMETRRMTAVK